MSQVDVQLAERKQYFVSDQTWEGLQICVQKDLLYNGLVKRRPISCGGANENHKNCQHIK